MEVVLAQPRGFCAGVVRAIDIVELAIDIYGPPVYVFHEIVHNRYVVDDLQTRGAVFVENLAEVPPGSVTIFSAHGVSTAIVKQAQQMQSRLLMLPARWSPRCIYRRSVIAAAAMKSLSSAILDTRKLRALWVP